MRFPETILTDVVSAALERDPLEVLEQVRSGGLSLDEAEWIYGVVLRGKPSEARFEVDQEATEQRRLEIRIAGAPPGGA